MPEDLKNNAVLMASIREGFRMQSVRRGNVYLLIDFVGHSAPLIFSLAGREYDGMVGRSGDNTSYIFKQPVEDYMGYVRDGDKPNEADARNNGQPEEPNNLRCGPG